MKQVTASVFSTGKIIVTGAETLQEIVFAYDILNKELSTTSTSSFDAPPQKSIILGADFQEWVRVLRARNVKSWT